MIQEDQKGKTALYYSEGQKTYSRHTSWQVHHLKIYSKTTEAILSDASLHMFY